MRNHHVKVASRDQIPHPLIAVVAEVFSDQYTHTQINSRFYYAGFPGDPPEGNRQESCHDWLRPSLTLGKPILGGAAPVTQHTIGTLSCHHLRERLREISASSPHAIDPANQCRHQSRKVHHINSSRC
jgi:hypothetical protein